MKKSDLKNGMIIETRSNRFGVVEINKNRINICYDKDVLMDEYEVLEKISLDDIFEFGDNQIGIGSIVTKETKEKYKKFFKSNKVGELVIWDEIVAVYILNKIYERNWIM